MKAIFSVLLFVIIIQFNDARAEGEDWQEKSIKEGNWNLGGGGMLAYDTYNGGRASGALGAQYFVADNLSLGILTSFYYFKSNNHALGLGPKATYYFYETEKKAFYVSQSIGFYWGENSVGASTHAVGGQTSVGFEHFFTSNVSFGPELRYQYYLDKNNASTLKNETAVLLNFNLFF